MAKGRRLTVSRSERYLGTYASHSLSHAVPVDDSDFSEEDVWSTIDGGAGQYDYYADSRAAGSQWDSRAAGSQWDSRASDTPRIRNVGGLSLAFEESGGRTTSSRIVHQLASPSSTTTSQIRRQQRHHMATSVPLSVPDWGRILRVDSMNDSEEVYFEDDRDSAVEDPPHEYLARSRKTETTSVFEGVGRTLKGRDMSRLRDAVWSQTGFDG